MGDSVSEQCRICITNLKTILSTLSDPSRQKSRVHHGQVNDELERFSLWTGNIGAVHLPKSPMSLESRLCEANDVLTHILQLLNDVNEVTEELLEILSGQREGDTASTPHHDSEEDQIEETELLKEIQACITRLFRASSLIRQATPTDTFAKALSRDRYQFNDQYDIAHVGEKYPKLATRELSWLRQRLGRAITRRRHYLSYIQDHREKLQSEPTNKDMSELMASKLSLPNKQLADLKRQPDSLSRPSTFITKASSLTPGHITTQMLIAGEDSNSESDAKSYTTISRSVQGDLDSSTIDRIPKLEELRTGSKKEVECPFCFRIKRIKSERVWRRHVYSDLRPYVCTFSNCDAPYFSDVNEWFRHEMQNHRTNYTCRICANKTFQLSEQYLNHVRNKHPSMLKDGEEQTVIDIAQGPLESIQAQDCPCCSEWVDRLKQRAAATNMPSNVSEHVLYVDPIVFKRHVASHLEQLALFAIPINLAGGDDVNSNAAVELGADLHRNRSNSPNSESSHDGRLEEFNMTALLNVERPLPTCPRATPTREFDDWYCLEGYVNFNLCPSCYDGVFAGTPFAPYFSQLPDHGATERFCDFSSPWPRLTWLLIIKQRRTSLDLIYSLAEILDHERPCPNDREMGFDRVDWYGIFDQRTGLHSTRFAICPCDVKMTEALFPSIRGYFTKFGGRPQSAEKLMCGLRVSSRRFPKYLDLLVELDAEARSLDQAPDLDRFTQMVRDNARNGECFRDRCFVGKLWYFISRVPEFTVCGECYHDFVVPAKQSGTSSIPSLFNTSRQTVPGEDSEIGTTCCLYSPRMRRVWDTSVKEDDFAYLKRKAIERKSMERSIATERKAVSRRLIGLERGSSDWLQTQKTLEELEKEWAAWE